jgi:hypothetical protein
MTEAKGWRVTGTERRHRLASVRGPVRHPFVPTVFVADRSTATAYVNGNANSQGKGKVNGAARRKGGAAGKSSRNFRLVRSSRPPLPSHVDYRAWPLIRQVGVKRRSHLARWCYMSVHCSLDRLTPPRWRQALDDHQRGARGCRRAHADGRREEVID